MAGLSWAVWICAASPFAIPLTWHAPFGADIVSLCLLARILKPKVIFEIGTFTGYTALHFALNTPEDAQIYTLDLSKDERADPGMQVTVLDQNLVKVHAGTQRYAFDDSNAAAKATCLYGDSATFDYSPYHGKVDLFFIDGAHSYEYVRSDTRNALKCCHPGSVIAWHDFGRVGVNGVSRWIRELSKEHEIFSIPGGSLTFMVVKG
jgi:predicted O-methyltransferase YrrM